MSNACAVVLAAGKGTRMKSDLPKVLTPVCGRPMIDYVLDTLEACGLAKTIVVVGYRADLVQMALVGRKNVEFVVQKEQLGTGHAVMVCRDALANEEGPILVVTGDSPLMQRDSIAALLAEFERTRPACLLGTARRDDPHGLGRIVRDAEGHFVAIVEERDATAEQKKITEVNMSCYLFSGPALLKALGKLRADNAQAEYYLTDCPGVLKESGERVEALPVLKPVEALSINTLDELSAVEAAMRSL